MNIEQLIDLKIEWYTKALNESKKLSKECISRDIFIAKESEALALLNELKAYINVFGVQGDK